MNKSVEKKRPNRWPGTDDETGWPVEPKHPCYRGVKMVGPQKGKDVLTLVKADIAVSEANKALEVICHLRLGGEEMVCGYEPPDCPFYGRYPDMRKQ